MVTMKEFLFLACTILYLIDLSEGLRCRSTEDFAKREGMEFAVRECIRKMRNHTEPRNEPKNPGRPPGKEWNRGLLPVEHRDTKINWDRGHRDNYREAPHRANMDKNNRNHNWESQNNGQGMRRPDEDDRERDDDDDYYNNPNIRRRPYWKDHPHSTGQQSQHDKDIVHSYNNRPLFQSSSNNKGQQADYDESEGSRLKAIDACTIHCIFSEMHLMDDRGRLNKQAVVEKFTNRLRNREMREFLQDTIDDCFDQLEQEFGQPNSNKNTNNRDGNNTCNAAKSLAMCLEDRGKQVCDDWENTLHRDNKGSSNNDGKQPTEPTKKKESGIFNMKRGG